MTALLQRRFITMLQRKMSFALEDEQRDNHIAQNITTCNWTASNDTNTKHCCNI